jgi:hypothetical protein
MIEVWAINMRIASHLFGSEEQSHRPREFTLGMDHYRGYRIQIEEVHGASRCIVTPTRPDLPILWRYAIHYKSPAEAVVDARRRIDELFCR